MPQNIKPLTAMRFFAAMWVVAMDYTPSLGLGMSSLVAKGYLGVELFFVLSGFILSHVYMESFGERRFSYPDFLWARLARVYPVHLATLVGLGLGSQIPGHCGYRVYAERDRILDFDTFSFHSERDVGFAPGLDR